MNVIRQAAVPIFFLLATLAAATPVWSADASDVLESSPPPSHAAEGDRETIMRRLRAIIDDLKRQGPPPVGCMEG